LSSSTVADIAFRNENWLTLAQCNTRREKIQRAQCLGGVAGKEGQNEAGGNERRDTQPKGEASERRALEIIRTLKEKCSDKSIEKPSKPRSVRKISKIDFKLVRHTDGRPYSSLL
jgi:hypothetical protein